MDSLKVTDAAAASVATAPRVRLEDIENGIDERYDLLGGDLVKDAALETFSLCILKMKNGFVVVGKSAPVSSENFNRELGRQFAYEDAVRQLWPLMGFALRDKLA